MRSPRFLALSLSLPLLLEGRPAAAADCNRNGIEDFQEVVSGRSADCDTNRVPDECDILPVNYGIALRTEISFPQGVRAFLAADLDGDGSPDVAVLPAEPNAALQHFLSVLWNLGGGRLGERSFHSVPADPRHFTAADIDGDGDTDLITVHSLVLAFLENLGARTFAAARTVPLEFEHRSIAFADLDRDGRLDLAAAAGFRLVVMQGSGGGFTEVQSLIVGSDPVAVAALDLDGDGDVDLATGNRFENVSVFLKGDAGLFEARGSFAAGGNVLSLLAGDLDADGDADFAAGLATGTSILFNQGDASFPAHSTFRLNAEVIGMTVDDLDGDGDVDVAAAGFGSLSYVPNHGGGVFGPARALEGLRGTESLIQSADLEGDGSLEILILDNDRAVLSIFERGLDRNSPDCNSDGVPDGCRLLEDDCNSNGLPDDCEITTDGPDCNSNGRPDECDEDCDQNGMPDDCDIAKGGRDCNSNGRPDECEDDCNQNGRPDDCDIASASSADCNRNGAPDECDLRARVDLPLPQVVDRSSIHHSLEIADIDRDGDRDLITLVSQMEGAIRVFLNGGGGTFVPLPDRPVGSAIEIAIQVGDLDGDGDPDLVLRRFPNTILGFLNDGQGSFPGFISAELDGVLRVADGGDLDGDADMDVAVANEAGRVSIISLGENGTLVSRIGFEAGGNVDALIASDLDSDGDLDLAISMLGENVLRTFSNDGTGRFERWKDSIVDRPGDPTIAADVTGDGFPDLVQASPLRFRRNRADGSFAAATDVPFAMPSPALAAADLDGDGRIDLAVGTMIDESCSPTSMIRLFRGDGAGRFTLIDGPKIDMMSVPIVVRSGDLDGDGAPDLAILTLPNCPCCEGPTQSGIFTVLNRTLPASSRDANRNRIPDECEGPSFHRGDAAPDGRMDITDAVSILNHLFQGGPALPCREAADAQNDGTIDITDPVYILDALFRGGPSPSPPGPPPNPCGPDPDPPGSEGHLGCETYEACGGG